MSETPAQSAPQTALRAMVADDDPTTRHMIATLLEQLGVRVTTAGNGEEVLSAIDAAKGLGESFNLYFLDMRMPKLDGVKTAHALRERGHQEPIFVFTGTATLVNKKESQAAGVTRYFAKAVLKKDLLRAILDEYVPRKR